MFDYEVVCYRLYLYEGNERKSMVKFYSEEDVKNYIDKHKDKYSFELEQTRRAVLLDD